MNVFGSIGTAIDLVKKAKELADKVQNLELKEVIVELREKLVEVKEEAVVYREKFEAMEAEIKWLKAPPEMELRDNLYYRKDNGDGPFCTACFDGGAKSIRATRTAEDMRMASGYKWVCPTCRAKYAE